MLFNISVDLTGEGLTGKNLTDSFIQSKSQATMPIGSVQQNLWQCYKNKQVEMFRLLLLLIRNKYFSN